LTHVNSLGTGGTIAGVGHFVKSLKPDVLIALSDPEGSGLYNKVILMPRYPMIPKLVSQVRYGVMFDRKESEGTRRRHQVDTIVEGM